MRLTATAGRGTVTFRLPRRAGRYVLELDLRAADQTATDRASVIVR